MFPSLITHLPMSTTLHIIASVWPVPRLLLHFISHFFVRDRNLDLGLGLATSRTVYFKLFIWIYTEVCLWQTTEKRKRSEYVVDCWMDGPFWIHFPNTNCCANSQNQSLTIYLSLSCSLYHQAYDIQQQRLDTVHLINDDQPSFEATSVFISLVSHHWTWWELLCTLLLVRYKYIYYRWAGNYYGQMHEWRCVASSTLTATNSSRSSSSSVSSAGDKAGLQKEILAPEVKVEDIMLPLF